MFGLLLAVVITTTTTPDADVEYLGALLCGETCGMPVEAQAFVAESLAYDYLAHGRLWLRGRWYAPLKGNEQATELMRAALELEAFRVCRLVGNGRDADYWRAGGYIAPDAVPDYEWQSHGMTVAAFDCARRARPARVLWSCQGDGCPM